jgi:hypothetical protein
MESSLTLPRVVKGAEKLGSGCEVVGVQPTDQPLTVLSNTTLPATVGHFMISSPEPDHPKRANRRKTDFDKAATLTGREISGLPC